MDREKGSDHELVIVTRGVPSARGDGCIGLRSSGFDFNTVLIILVAAKQFSRNKEAKGSYCLRLSANRSCLSLSMIELSTNSLGSRRGASGYSLTKFSKIKRMPSRVGAG